MTKESERDGKKETPLDLATFKKNDYLLEILNASTAYDVVLSYDEIDQSTVYKLRDRLVERGLRVWADADPTGDGEDEIPQDQRQSSFSKCKVAVLSKCKVAVVFASENYEKSANGKTEIEYLDKKKISMIFVRTNGDFEAIVGGSLELVIDGIAPHLLAGDDEEGFDKVVSVVLEKVEGEKKED